MYICILGPGLTPPLPGMYRITIRYTEYNMYNECHGEVRTVRRLYHLTRDPPEISAAAAGVSNKTLIIKLGFERETPGCPTSQL